MGWFIPLGAIVVGGAWTHCLVKDRSFCEGCLKAVVNARRAVEKMTRTPYREMSYVLTLHIPGEGSRGYDVVSR